MKCTCNKNKKYIKEDWSYWTKACDEHKKAGSGTEFFVVLTKRHKIRLMIGIRGKMQSGKYCFGSADKLPKVLHRPFYKFMFYVGDPVLNFLIGYKKIKNPR